MIRRIGDVACSVACMSQHPPSRSSWMTRRFAWPRARPSRPRCSVPVSRCFARHLGTAAAALAATLGVDTIVLDEQRAPGGQIYRAIETVQARRTDDLRILGEEYTEGAALA